MEDRGAAVVTPERYICKKCGNEIYALPGTPHDDIPLCMRLISKGPDKIRVCRGQFVREGTAKPQGPSYVAIEDFYRLSNTLWLYAMNNAWWSDTINDLSELKDKYAPLKTNNP